MIDSVNLNISRAQLILEVRKGADKTERSDNENVQGVIETSLIKLARKLVQMSLPDN